MLLSPCRIIYYFCCCCWLVLYTDTHTLIAQQHKWELFFWWLIPRFFCFMIFRLSFVLHFYALYSYLYFVWNCRRIHFTIASEFNVPFTWMLLLITQITLVAFIFGISLNVHGMECSVFTEKFNSVVCYGLMVGFINVGSYLKWKRKHRILFKFSTTILLVKWWILM